MTLPTDNISQQDRKIVKVIYVLTTTKENTFFAASLLGSKENNDNSNLTPKLTSVKLKLKYSARTTFSTLKFEM